MARYIDSDALKARLEIFSKWCRDGRKQGVDFVLDCTLPDMPTADVVAVVRCKDCKHKVVTSDGEYNPEDIVCDYHASDGFDSNDFCSYGEKAAQQVVDANSARSTPDPAASLKSEVERLEKALAAKDAEYDKALQDKARECNMVVDKICLEHRAKLALLHSSHEQELAKAKREVARKIFADIEFLIDKYSLEPNYLLLHLKKDIAEFKKQHNKN